MIAKFPNFSISFSSTRLSDLIEAVVFCVLVKDASDAVTETIADDAAERSENYDLQKTIVAEKGAVGENARQEQRHIALDRAEREDGNNAEFRDKFVKLLLHIETAEITGRIAAPY